MTLERLVPPLLLMVLLAAGCDRSITSFSQNGFSARAGEDAALLRNQSADTIRYVALDEGMAAFVDLAPAESWPTVGPGAQTTVPYSQLNSRSRPRALRIYWWTKGQYQPTIHLDVP